jgi:hypothetical protein
MSRLAHLNAPPVEETADPHAPYDRVEPDLSLWFEDAKVVVYFDTERFQNDEDVAARLAEYEAMYGDTPVVPEFLSLADFSYRHSIPFPAAQAAFLRRGYVSSREFRRFSRGKDGQSKYLATQKEYLHATAFVLNEMLLQEGPALLGWDFLAQRLLGEKPETLKAFLRRMARESLAPLTGADSVERDELTTDYALVESNGLLLGRDQANGEDRIHLALSGKPSSFLKNGAAAIEAGSLGGLGTKEVAYRIALELSPAGLTAFFGAARWPTTSTAGQPPVTSAMVVTAYSQYLTGLRKLTWRAETEESVPVLKNALLKEAARREAAGLPRAMDGEPPPVGVAQRFLRDILNTEIDAVQERFPGAWADDITFALSERLLALGALFGMDIDLDGGTRPPREELWLPSWVGRLRRKGKAEIYPDFLDDLDRFTTCASEECQDFVFGLLSEGSWRAILEAASEVAETGNVISVSYRLADLEDAWQVRRHDGGLSIAGPFLMFPVIEAAQWAEKADWLRENGDFIAP